MNFARFTLLGLSLPLLAVACASAREEPTSAASQDMTTEWLESNIPPGSSLERKVLVLANDPTMTSARFQNECGYTDTQANNIIAYRRGDSTDASDDQRFDTLAELDAVPYTDAPFWAKTVSCTMLHVPGPGACAADPVIVEVVIDESGSMTADQKWPALRDSVLGLFDKLRTSAHANLYVGALGFDDNVSFTVTPRPLTTAQHDLLVRKVDRPAPSGGTTGLENALATAYDNVDGVEGSSGMRRIVVLLTDGSPSGGETEKQRSIDLALDAHARGIELYAVGIGKFPSTSPGMYDPTFMGKLASAGGTAPAGCDPSSTDLTKICHVQVSPSPVDGQLKADLTTALDAIHDDAIEAAPSCP